MMPPIRTFMQEDLERYMREAVKVSNDSPVLLDRHLSDAIEIDVDCVCDGKNVLIGGIMEHVEQAGVHSGDSACCLPPHSLASHLERELRRQTGLMAKALKVLGLMNVQYAIQRDTVFVLEVNPRASPPACGCRRAAGPSSACATPTSTPRCRSRSTWSSWAFRCSPRAAPRRS